MFFCSPLLTFNRSLENIAYFLDAHHKVWDVQNPERLKIDYLNLAYALQLIPIEIKTSDVQFVNTLDSDFESFIALYPADVQTKMRSEYAQSRWTENEFNLFQTLFNEALEKLARLSPDLLQTLFMHVFKIYCLPGSTSFSRSKIQAWGLFIMTPQAKNIEKEPYAIQIFEGVIHECLHQFLFLESVIRPFLHDRHLTLLADKPDRFKGALTLNPRPVEVTLHSLVIANVLMQLHIADNHVERARALYPNYVTSLAHFTETLTTLPEALLTDNGQAWLQKLQETPWPAELVA